MEQLKKMITEVLQERDLPSEFVKGVDFDTIVTNTYRRAIARELMELIDEGKVRHFQNRYWIVP